MVSQLLAHNSWNDNKATLETHFQVKVQIHPFMADKALIIIQSGISPKTLELAKNWQRIKDFHPIIEKWSDENHYHLDSTQGYGGQISIKNLP